MKDGFKHKQYRLTFVDKGLVLNCPKDEEDELSKILTDMKNGTGFDEVVEVASKWRQISIDLNKQYLKLNTGKKNPKKFFISPELKITYDSLEWSENAQAEQKN